MVEYYDVSGVTLGNTPPVDPPNQQNVGLWHNYYCYMTLLNYQNMGTSDPDLSTWLTQLANLASSHEAAGDLPTGSTDVVNQIITTIEAGESDTTYDNVINGLSAINDATAANPDYANTTLVGVTSVAYCSAVLNSQTKNDDGHTMGIPKWLKGLCADIGGALGGSAFGPIGEIVGAACATVAAI